MTRPKAPHFQKAKTIFKGSLEEYITYPGTSAPQLTRVYTLLFVFDASSSIRSDEPTNMGWITPRIKHYKGLGIPEAALIEQMIPLLISNLFLNALKRVFKTNQSMTKKSL